MQLAEIINNFGKSYGQNAFEQCIMYEDVHFQQNYSAVKRKRGKKFEAEIFF